MTYFGPTVSLHSGVASPVARGHLRKLYRHARRSGSTRFDSRVMVMRALLAAECEGDETFGQGVRAELMIRRVVVGFRRAGGPRTGAGRPAGCSR